MSTHDLDLALQMSDRLWLLNSDEIVAGSPEDLVLNNAFQMMFNKKGIEFDNKTGLFRVDYALREQMAVKGHGFEYVLLRRALARKGIKTIQKQEQDTNWLEIDRTEGINFRWYQDGKCVDHHTSVEKIIQAALR